LSWEITDVGFMCHHFTILSPEGLLTVRVTLPSLR